MKAVGTIKVEPGRLFVQLYPKILEGVREKWSPECVVFSDEEKGLIKVYKTGTPEECAEFCKAGFSAKQYGLIKRFVKISAECFE
jgi:hypothetical protein